MSRTVVLPRGGGWALTLRSLIADRGFRVAVVPLITILPSTDPDALNRAFRGVNAGEYRAVFVTSGVTARIMRRRLVRVPAVTEVVAVGRGTARALEEVDIRVDTVTVGVSNAAAMAEQWLDAHRHEARDRPLLLPASSLADPAPAARLAAEGWRVERVEAYRTVPATLGEVELELLRDDPAAIVLGSGSQFRALSAALGPALARAGLVCIGQRTAQAVRAAGFEPAAVAATQNPEGLAAALGPVLEAADGKTSSGHDAKGHRSTP